MNTNTVDFHKNIKKTATLVGLFFLAAMVASLLGGSLIESVLSAQDYLVSVGENETLVIIGVFLELINAISVLGIGALMFPIFRKFSESMAVGYLGLRIVEAVFCSIIVISPLSLITISREITNAGTSDISFLEMAGSLSIAGRANVAGLLIPVFLSLGGLVFYTLLYRSELLPRFIAVWGLVGAALILALNILLTFNVAIGTGLAMIFALPIITNEIFLGIWLIVKGFNPSAAASPSQQ